MKSDIRRQALENYAKDVKSGLYLTEDYVKKSPDVKSTALKYRDLAEDTLANEVLKSTGVKIPGKGANKSQIENFFADIMRERYPELKNNGIEVRKLVDELGLYDPDTGIIRLDEDMVNRITRGEPIQSVSTLLHELGHKYDYEHLKKPTFNDLENKDIRAAVKKIKPNVTTDPTVIGEAVLDNHHNWISKLREGSFGFGALKSILKDGTFKGVAPVIAKGALAAGTGLASLASEAADTEETGDAPEQAALLREIDERKRRDANPELAPLYQNIDNNSQVKVQDTLKLNALKKLAGK